MSRTGSTSICSRKANPSSLSNGHIGLRGNLDEGDPHGLPGTYLNSFYKVRPLPYAEAGYGFPETGQTVINVTNGKIIRIGQRTNQGHRLHRVLRGDRDTVRP